LFFQADSTEFFTKSATRKFEDVVTDHSATNVSIENFCVGLLYLSRASECVKKGGRST